MRQEYIDGFMSKIAARGDMAKLVIKKLLARSPQSSISRMFAKDMQARLPSALKPEARTGFSLAQAKLPADFTREYPSLGAANAATLAKQLRSTRAGGKA